MNRPWRDRFDRPVNIPQLFLALALVLLGLSSLIAVVVVSGAKGDEKDRADNLAAQLEESQDTSNCRAKLASDVTDATTTYLFAQGRMVRANGTLVIAIARGTDRNAPLEQIDLAASQMSAAEQSLDFRRDRRVAFEQRPTPDCPEAVPPTLDTSDPSPVTSSVSTVRRSTTTRQPLTSTTGSTTSTTYSTPATAPPTPLCDLLPVTVPDPVPCL